MLRRLLTITAEISEGIFAGQDSAESTLEAAEAAIFNLRDAAAETAWRG